MAGFRPCFIQDCELVERVSQLPLLVFGLESSQPQGSNTLFIIFYSTDYFFTPTTYGAVRGRELNILPTRLLFVYYLIKTEEVFNDYFRAKTFILNIVISV